MTIEVGDPTTWGVVFGVMIFQWLIEQFLNRALSLQVRITLDVLENMKSIDSSKDCIRNIFTNLAIVAALIMTIAFAMLFIADHMEDLGDITDDDYDKWLIAHGFIAATGYAAVQSMRAMVESVLNLIYTEALSSSEVIRFLIHGPGAIGAPVLATIFSMVSIILASTLFVLQMYSVAAAAAFGLLATSRLWALLGFWLKRASFTTDREGKQAKKWTWAESTDEPAPSAITKKCSVTEIEVMRRRATEARRQELDPQLRAGTGVDPTAARL